jgi:putative endopeptidase
MLKNVEGLRDYVDENVKPGDDFFQYANGKWLDTTEIPDDKPTFGSFTELRDLSLAQVKSVLEKDYDDPEMKKATYFFNAGTNIEKRNQEDYEGLKGFINDIKLASNREELVNVIATLGKESVTTIFNFYPSPDRLNSSMEVPHIISGGISLPNVHFSNKDYYFDEDKQHIREKYLEMLEKYFTFIDEENPQTHAKNVLELETKLAELHYTQVEKRDPQLSYNKKEISELKELSPAIDWNTYFKGFVETEITFLIVDKPDFFEKLSDLLETVDLEVWKSYLIGRLLNSSANYLSERFENAFFDFYGKVLSGSRQQEELWKRIVNLLNNRFILGELVGKLYVQEYFPPEAKEKMLELVNNLLIVLEDRIKKLDWMSDETKAKALEKLSKFNVKIGYPDVWEDYSTLDLREDDSFVEMLRKCSKFIRDKNFSRLYLEPDKNKWFMSPQTVNAYFNPTKNEIVFPAAILQFPFFDLKMSNAENYGGIGVVIGHEITHGFDDKGSMFDGDGNMKMWWTADDKTAFENKGQYFIEEYEKFLVNDKPLNGKLTLGENIADHGGVKIAFNALMVHYDKQGRNEDDESLKAEQKFFLSFARIWRSKTRPEHEERQRASDPHSPPKARVNVTLANIKEFHNAYNITENDTMYRSQLPNLW